jgi:hypothetical protein
VTSRSGIGGATLVRVGKSWPPAVTIRLKLNNLESFTMSNGDIQFNTSIRTSGRVPYCKVGRNERRPDAPDGTLEAPIRRVDGWFEIDVPHVMLEELPEEIDFAWINEYRG